MAIQKLGLPGRDPRPPGRCGIHTDGRYSATRAFTRVAGRPPPGRSSTASRIVHRRRLPGHSAGTGDITTLGRGGSDTTAVAHRRNAQGADLCQIYTDVDGVYTADPRHRARMRASSHAITYDEMLELASRSALRYCTTARLQMAKKLQCRSRGRCRASTRNPGTKVKEGSNNGKTERFSGVAQ